ncbi:hypothetical protein O3P69_016651 [Scylla paramamosain]|uniref:Uncharacterized protein n=1 Tax=Scylla paramamosain TaxID=85552 RepID=A0AAW0SZI3_SCYPA
MRDHAKCCGCELLPTSCITEGRFMRWTGPSSPTAVLAQYHHHHHQGHTCYTCTVRKFMTRCCLFCMLWLVTDYMHVYSLQILDCTDVMALYSAHVSFV